MKLLVLSYERLISNGSAGTTVMCGLVASALNRGWDVTYVAICRSHKPSTWEIPFDFGSISTKLRQESLCYSRISTGPLHRFAGSFNQSLVTRIDEAPSALAESYDGIVAFDSLPMTLARSIAATQKVIIIGDPAGRRLWHSTPWSKPLNKIKAVLLDIAELVFYRSIPQQWTIAMFGSGHAARWSRGLARPILDIRPFIPVPELNLEKRETEKPIIYFGGSLTGTASRQSVAIIFGEILPALRRRFGIGGFEMRLAGDCPEYFLKLTAPYEEIKVLGRVASFETELALGNAFILPMNYPVGVRTRVCSALAAGNVCLVHPSVLYNMPELANCSAVRVVSTPDQYAKAISELPRGHDLLNLCKSARDFFNSHYAAQVASAKILDVIPKACTYE